MAISSVYFIGIGGIGMSAIARYFMHEGKLVGGYDRVSTPLTAELESEGALIHYYDDVSLIDPRFFDKETTLVVYTPAVPDDHSEYSHFIELGITPVKRSRMLGHLSEGKYVMAVAGTHGKTTTTTITAWMNHIAGGGGSAFLGGISKNFNSNLVLGKGDRLAVEADEFDRSFLQLTPSVAVITSADADHLDIYGTHEAVKEAFSQFVDNIKNGGALIIKKGVDIEIRNRDIKVYRYSVDQPCDFYASGIELQDGGTYRFDLVMPDTIIKDCTLGIPGRVNIENCVAAASMLWFEGFDVEKLKQAMASFSGVKRRFDFYINTPELVYMDDYAHHPAELHAAIMSLRGMFADRKLTVIFQPHLYSRTNDLYREFAVELSAADNVILLPVYPAREEPIAGVDSDMIRRLITSPCLVIEKTQLIDYLASAPTDVVVSFGAGDIDRYCDAIAETLKNKILR